MISYMWATVCVFLSVCECGSNFNSESIPSTLTGIVQHSKRRPRVTPIFPLILQIKPHFIYFLHTHNTHTAFSSWHHFEDEHESQIVTQTNGFEVMSRSLNMLLMAVTCFFPLHYTLSWFSRVKDSAGQINTCFRVSWEAYQCDNNQECPDPDHSYQIRPDLAFFKVLVISILAFIHNRSST